MKASEMVMRLVLAGVSAATLFLLPMRSLGIGVTILEEINQRWIDGSYRPVPGLGVDYANISVSDDLLRIESRHSESFSYQGSGSYGVASGGRYLVTFRTDEALAYEAWGMTVRRISGPYEGSGRSDPYVGTPTFSVFQNGSYSDAEILPAGIYTVSGSAALDYYANAPGLPYSFSAEAGYEFVLELRPLSVPDGGTTLGLLGFGLVGMAVLRRKKAQPQE